MGKSAWWARAGAREKNRSRGPVLAGVRKKRNLQGRGSKTSEKGKANPGDEGTSNGKVLLLNGWGRRSARRVDLPGKRSKA